MKLIEDYRDIYKGKEIWILGCGPSLDDYPDDFFNDKITIALNEAFVAFPKCNFIIYVHKCVEVYIKKNRPEFMKKSILILPPKAISKQLWLTYLDSEEAIYMRWNGNTKCPKTDFEKAAKYIMEKKSCLYPQYGTVAHWGVQAAIIMGARKVTMAGCEAKAAKHKYHAQNRGMSNIYHEPPQVKTGEYGMPEQTGNTPFFQNCRIGTRWLKEVFEPYGIEIMRYFYNKGYEKIT